jgi:TRAP-type C4-dicarboxylate transport system substrate-binding protein
MKSAVGLALAWATLSLASAGSAQTQWDLATNYPAGAFHTRNIVQFAADVDKATSGSLKMAVHPGGTIIKHTEIKRAVGEGRAAAGEVLISLAADEAPVYGVDSIPFLATGYDGARKLYDAQKPFLKGNSTRKDWSFCFRCRGHRKVSMPSARSRRSTTSRVSNSAPTMR